MRDHQQYTRLKYVSLEVCKDICEHDLTCRSINYQASTSKCYTVKKTLKEANETFLYRNPFTGFDVIECEEGKIIEVQ